jgi:hypothetical protein
MCPHDVLRSRLPAARKPAVAAVSAGKGERTVITGQAALCPGRCPRRQGDGRKWVDGVRSRPDALGNLLRSVCSENRGTVAPGPTWPSSAGTATSPTSPRDFAAMAGRTRSTIMAESSGEPTVRSFQDDGAVGPVRSPHDDSTAHHHPGGGHPHPRLRGHRGRP